MANTKDSKLTLDGSVETIRPAANQQNVPQTQIGNLGKQSLVGADNAYNLQFGWANPVLLNSSDVRRAVQALQSGASADINTLDNINYDAGTDVKDILVGGNQFDIQYGDAYPVVAQYNPSAFKSGVTFPMTPSANPADLNYVDPAKLPANPTGLGGLPTKVYLTDNGQANLIVAVYPTKTNISQYTGQDGLSKPVEVSPLPTADAGDPDILIGKGGPDNQFGGPGNDTLIAGDAVVKTNPDGTRSVESIALEDDRAQDIQEGEGGRDTIYTNGSATTNFPDIARGGDADDVLSSKNVAATNPGASNLDGGKGDDTFDTGPSRDVATGGEGNDTYNASKTAAGATDFSDMGAGNDTYQWKGLDGGQMKITIFRDAENGKHFRAEYVDAQGNSHPTEMRGTENIVVKANATTTVGINPVTELANNKQFITIGADGSVSRQ